MRGPAETDLTAGLTAAHCWERDDHVPGRPATTAFRRVARLQQARWREQRGFPPGTQPIRPRPGAPVRTVGSRVPLDLGESLGANFVTAGALAAARQRAALIEPHQSVDHLRLWADLLSSPALAFNLFGDVSADLEAADRVVRAWFPDAPGRVVDVRFLHSPGRFDPTYLNSLRDFAVAFVLELDDGTFGIVAVDVKFHERNKAETPKPQNREWYERAAIRSGAFSSRTIDALLGTTEHCVMWLEHLLLHSMLQHRSGAWSWGRYVVVRHDANPDVADLLARYHDLLADDTTFSTITLSELLDSRALPAPVADAVRSRYVLA